MVGKRCHPMGADFWLYVGTTTVCQQQVLSDFKGCCAMCGLPLSRRKTALPPRRLEQFPSPQGACNCSEFQARPGCQVGQRAELPQPSFCACASSHMTVNTRALCRTYHQNLKILTSSASRIVEILRFPPSF